MSVPQANYNNYGQVPYHGPPSSRKPLMISIAVVIVFVVVVVVLLNNGYKNNSDDTEVNIVDSDETEVNTVDSGTVSSSIDGSDDKINIVEPEVLPEVLPKMVPFVGNEYNDSVHAVNNETKSVFIAAINTGGKLEKMVMTVMAKEQGWGTMCGSFSMVIERGNGKVILNETVKLGRSPYYKMFEAKYKRANYDIWIKPGDKIILRITGSYPSCKTWVKSASVNYIIHRRTGI